MRTNEQRLWDTMLRQKNKTQQIPSSKLMHQRIENRVGAGVPDTFWKPVDFSDCWIELKAPQIAHNQRPTTKLFRGHAQLNVDQRNWALDYTRCGGRWYVVARDTDNELYMFHKPFIMEINNMTLPDARAFRIADNWRSIFHIIRGGYHEA